MTISDKNAVKTIDSRIWKFFGSLRLTLFVLFSLAAFSVVGTVIQQNQPTEFYSAEYGEWASLILRVGLEDMYHAWWFSTLLILLVLNIIVCTIDRFPPKWKGVLESKTNVDVKFIKNLLNRHTVTLRDEPAFVKERIVNILRKKRYNVEEAGLNGGADGISIYAWKGTIGRFGSDIVHVSLLLILCGVIIGSIAGFKDFGAFYEGELITIPVTELRLTIDRSWHGIPIPKIDRQKMASDIQLRLDKFWIDYYESGQIKQFNSILTLSDSGVEVIKGRQIWVNAPLSYKGVTFYQSSYGTAYDRVKQGEFFLKDTKTKKTLVFSVPWNTLYNIPGTDYKIKIVGFVSDFAFDPASRTIFTKSAEHNNPAVNIEVYKKDTLVGRPWLFYNYADIFTAIPDSDYELVFSSYKGILYTGLSINKDPGTNVVWIGSALMVIGFFIAFFIFHKKIWVNVRKGSLETEVHIGGMINKNKFVFERELSEIVDEIKSGSSVEVK